ncbi:GGDEF domain-containing protein [Thalassotalea ganghwensis]
MVKHHDSIAQAEQKLVLATEQLQSWNLPATPINYAVCYEYISGKNTTLIALVNQELAEKNSLDNFFMEDTYRQLVLGTNSFRDEIITDIDNLLTDIDISNTDSYQQVEQFILQVDKQQEHLYSQDQRRIKLALQNIKKASRQFKIQQQNLSIQIQESQSKNSALREELEEIRKEVYLDPLTGLYNRKALNKHLAQWIKANPEQQMAAIVINIDQIAELTQQFGSLISDVLIAKVANKVNSYVGESGFPVRASGDEFLILLPEMERNVAAEIAEKIRQGVEKLRFVSSKTGIKLPQMTLSLAVNDFTLRDNVHAAIKETKELLSKHVQTSRNSIAIAS